MDIFDIIINEMLKEEKREQPNRIRIKVAPPVERKDPRIQMEALLGEIDKVLSGASKPVKSQPVKSAPKKNYRTKPYIPDLVKVDFSGPVTVAYWSDNTLTTVRCQEGDEFDKETGLLAAIAKKAFGNSNNFNEVLKRYCYDTADIVSENAVNEETAEKSADNTSEGTNGETP